MGKVVKIILIVVVVLVVLVIGAVVLVASQFDKIVKAGIEQGGTYATGVEATVDTVDVSLTKGTFDMAGFELANPPEFDTPHFIALGDTDVALNADKTTRQVVTLSTLTLSDLDIYLDKGADPSNYNFVLENLKRFESGKAPPEDAAMRVVIESLVIEDIGVHLANMPGIGMVAGDVAVEIPRIELKNVGADEPMTFGQVVALVVKTVLAASVEAGGGIIPADVLGELTGGLGSLESLSALGITAVGDLGKQIEEQLGGTIDQAQDAIDEARDVGEDLQNQADEAADKLKGIFGGGDKDDDTDP